VLSNQSDLRWTSLALSNCFGNVNEHRKGVIYSFWKALTSNESPTIFGAEVSRDFIFVDDVIEAIKLAIKTPSMRRVNISSNTEISIGTLYEKISRLLKKRIVPVVEQPILGEIFKSHLDNRLAKEIWGWEPNFDINEGLRLALERTI
jgi:nucleoside-diphosphate-sugar epimerase